MLFRSGRVWDAIKGAAAYAFNASHSYAYAWLAYCTAYLKANWTAEYGAALLSVTEKAERRQMVLAALRKDGVTVLGPSVNESRFTTSVDESGAVRIGLSEIKDVGSDIVHLIDERDANGPFASLSDVAVRVRWTPDGETKPKSIPSDKLVALIEAGAFDDFGPRLGQAMIAKAVSKAPSIAPVAAEWPQLERAARERDRLKVLLSPHPLATMDDLRSWRSRAGERPCSVANIPTNDGDRCLVLGMIASWEERAYSGGRMARFTLEGSAGSLEGVVWAGTVRKLAELGTTPASVSYHVRQLERHVGVAGDAHRREAVVADRLHRADHPLGGGEGRQRHRLAGAAQCVQAQQVFGLQQAGRERRARAGPAGVARTREGGFDDGVSRRDQ